MLKFQTEDDEKTGEKVLTCYLLPQQPSPSLGKRLPYECYLQYRVLWRVLQGRGLEPCSLLGWTVLRYCDTCSRPRLLNGRWQLSKAEIVKAEKLLFCQVAKKLQPSLKVFCFDLLTERFIVCKICFLSW